MLTMSAKGEPRRSLSAKKVLKGLLPVVVVGLAAWFMSAAFGGFGEAVDALSDLSGWALALLFLTCLLNIALYPITAMAAINKLKYLPAFLSRHAGFLVSNAFPGGGAVAVGVQYSILARFGVDRARAAVSVTVDMIWTYLFTWGLPTIGMGILVLRGGRADGYVLLTLLGAAVTVVSFSVIYLAVSNPKKLLKLAPRVQRLVDKVTARIGKESPNIAEKVEEFHEHSSDVLLKRWRSLSVTNLVAQLLPLLVLTAALYGLGQFELNLSAAEVLAAYSIAFLLTALPISPGGLGTVDAALVALLVAFGCDPGAAVAADLLWRLVWFLPQMIVGGLCVLGERLATKRDNQEIEVAEK